MKTPISWYRLLKRKFNREFSRIFTDLEKHIRESPRKFAINIKRLWAPGTLLIAFLILALSGMVSFSIGGLKGMKYYSSGTSPLTPPSRLWPKEMTGLFSLRAVLNKSFAS
jgi:hypothetical protein